MDARLELVEAEAQASLCEAGGLPVLRIGGASCTVNPHLRDNPMLNRVNGLGVGRPAGDAELDEIDRFFRAHRTRYGVGVSPLAGPDLARRLRERGFEDGYAWTKFRRGVEPPRVLSSSLRVDGTAAGDLMGDIVADAFGLPPQLAPIFRRLPEREGWHCFVAYDGDEPAAAAALFAHAGVGWLGISGTRPEHRGKGAQGALLAARIARARELGLGALTTETGERVEGRPATSYRNIVRAGFGECYLRPNLVSPS